MPYYEELNRLKHLPTLGADAEPDDDRLHIENALLILEGTFDSMPRVARSMFKMSEILEKMGRQDEAAVKRKEANRLRNEITTIKFDPGLTEKAFDTLIPSFLC